MRSHHTRLASEVPLLVVSCDRYADLWPPFFELFRRRWPYCPFPLYLGSNYRACDRPEVMTVYVGDDVSWASGVRRMLDRIGAEHVILFLEDFLIKEPVSTPDVLRLVQTALDYEVACVRLSPLPPPSRPPDKRVPALPFLGVIVPGTPYRVSAQPAVWRVDVLRRYLVPGFTAWEFELLGTQMSEYRDDVFWGPFDPTIVYDHGVEKGRWKPEGLAICREAGVDVDLSARGVFSDAERETHRLSGIFGTAASATKLAAIEAFRSRRRVEGVKRVSRLLAAQPWVLQLWAIALFGAIGPGAINWLRRQHLRRRIRASLKRESIEGRSLVSQFL